MTGAPLARWVPGLALVRGRRGPGLRRDLIAGVVLAALLVPQGMGYAQLAGLPPVTGLYATLIPLACYFVLGPSRILIISPDSAVCPLVAAAIVPLARADPDAWVALAGLLAVTVGMIMLAGGLTRFGFVTELLSMPVRVGCSASSTSAPPAGCTGGAAASSRSPSPRSPASPCSACCGASGSRSPCRS